MGLNFRRNVRCMMFKRQTHLTLLGFGWNVHCLPIRVAFLFGWGQAHYCSWKAKASYSLTSVSPKRLRVHVVDHGAHELSASPL